MAKTGLADEVVMKTRAPQMNLVVPDKIRLELHPVATPNAPPQVLQLPAEKIAIELHKPPDTRSKQRQIWGGLGKGVWLFIKDVLPPLASALIAFFVFYYGKQFNDRQVQAQEAQVNTGKSELELKILSDFTTSLTELSSESETRQTLAAIKFVQYGEQALPIIKIALGVEENTVRKGATVVVAQMVQSEKIDRQKLLFELREYFKNQNAYLRRGVLECFVKLKDHLSSKEADEVEELLKNHLEPQADCSKPKDENVLFEAAIFLGGRASLDSKELLLKVAENLSCIKPRIQAVDNLAGGAEKLSPEARQAIIVRLQRLKPDGSASLSQSIKAAIEEIAAIK